MENNYDALRDNEDVIAYYAMHPPKVQITSQNQNLVITFPFWAEKIIEESPKPDKDEKIEEEKNLRHILLKKIRVKALEDNDETLIKWTINQFWNEIAGYLLYDIKNNCNESIKSNYFDEIVQDCAKAFSQSIDKWNPDKGNLSTYASFLFRNSRIKLINNANANTNSPHFGSLTQKVKKAQEELKKAGKETSNIALLSSMTNLSVNEVETGLAYMSAANSISLDDEEAKRHYSRSVSPEDAAIQADILEKAKRATQLLPSPEKEVMNYYWDYILETGEEPTAAKIAKALGLTGDKAQGALNRAKRILRKDPHLSNAIETQVKETGFLNDPQFIEDFFDQTTVLTSLGFDNFDEEDTKDDTTPTLDW